jgi:hypothetical protein
VNSQQTFEWDLILMLLLFTAAIVTVVAALI